MKICAVQQWMSTVPNVVIFRYISRETKFRFPVGGNSVAANSVHWDRGWFDDRGRANALIEVHIELPGGAITPRMVQLLDRIFESGSIRQAALAKGMSYRTAWIMVQEVEKIVGRSIIQRRAGGASGGGSRLSEAGQRLLRSCRRIETLANRAAKTELKNLSAVTNKKIRRKS